MSLWANIKFFPEPTGKLYGWLLATLVSFVIIEISGGGGGDGGGDDLKLSELNSFCTKAMSRLLWQCPGLLEKQSQYMPCNVKFEYNISTTIHVHRYISIIVSFY